MDGPLTVLDSALTMQRQYIAGMDREAEGAKTLIDIYTEISTQLDSEIPQYVQMYTKGISVILLCLSAAQAQYYDDISKIFEMALKEKGMKGDRESYRRDRPNGKAPKLRVVSVYEAIKEDRQPVPKEMDHGSYGCGEGHTKQIWEDTAGDYLSRLEAGADKWRKERWEESTGNTGPSFFLGRLTSKNGLSIGSRSTPALNGLRDGPPSTPSDSPPDAAFHIDRSSQRSPSPTPAFLPVDGSLDSHQNSVARVIPAGIALQRTATIPSTMVFPHTLPVLRTQFTPSGHHRSRSHAYPLGVDKALPAIPPSEGLPTGGAPAVPPRPPGGHRRQRSEGQPRADRQLPA
jgi:hypothetical protein